jgi:hypothetical protein
LPKQRWLRRKVLKQRHLEVLHPVYGDQVQVKLFFRKEEEKENEEGADERQHRHLPDSKPRPSVNVIRLLFSASLTLRQNELWNDPGLTRKHSNMLQTIASQKQSGWFCLFVSKEGKRVLEQ